MDTGPLDSKSPLRLFALLALSSLAACGGGGGGGGNATPNSPAANSGIPWTAGVFQPRSRFVAQCAAPRSGVNPRTGAAYPDVQGTATSENHWLRSWTNELYLWYDEVTDRDPAASATPAYFDLLKTTALTASGNPKDKFHFTMNTAEWELLSQTGVSAGYGAQFVVIASLPPRRVVVAYVEPGSPAAAASVQRGSEVLTIDAVDVINNGTVAGVNTINAGLFPDAVGANHSFTLREVSGTTRTVTMQSANVTSVPVQNVSTIPTASGPVGYMLFNDHIATAEVALINAVNTLKAANITDLILDVRYNGGGFLDIADELAYMIAGPVPTAGRTFERIVFSNKHPSTNPVTTQPLLPLGFHTTALGFSAPNGQALPVLNLPRVFVITGSGTCSASESVINGLRGVDVEVIQIGSTTCGKPYGFYPADNCGTTYFSIQFRGENAKGFGDYGDGFSPANTAGTRGTPLPGCSIGDDFTRALGNVDEARIAAALQYRTSQTCPAASGFGPQPQSVLSGDPEAVLKTDGLMGKLPWLENRILRQSP